MNKKVKRGASFVISEELFNEFLSQYLGFEPDSLQIWHITNQHYMRAVEVSVTSDDERFPVVPEGTAFPRLVALFDQEKISDDPLKYKIKFAGFSGV